MSLEILQVFLKCIAGTAAVVSAFLWWKSSTIEIREDHPKADKTSGVYLNGVDVLTTYRIQAKWNKWAAIATGVSVLSPWFDTIFQ
jgi:hypothetical protein